MAALPAVLLTIKRTTPLLLVMAALPAVLPPSNARVPLLMMEALRRR